MAVLGRDRHDARTCGYEVGRVGLLGRAGAGSCPNLLQRRSAAGSAARRSAEYQRSSSRVPARSGPLQQIWTTCAVAGPGRGATGWPATTAGAPIDRTGDLNQDRDWADPESSELRGARGIRTPDLFHAMEARYQLRHSPEGRPPSARTGRLVELGGFEPPTSSMPWKRATNCAIAPRTGADPRGRRGQL